MAASESPLFVKSVEKAFAVLRAFTRDSQSMSLAKIALHAGLDKSSAQRFVYTLHALGYLSKDANSRSYQLSPRLLEFGFTYLDMDPVITSSQQHLKDLHDLTGETVNLARLDGTDIILVARWPSNRIISINIRVGSRLPALYMASGRVLVSHRKEEEQEAILRQTQIAAHTDQSIVNEKSLRDELRRVREQGYSVTRSQYFRGDLSIAAPIFDARGGVSASVSVNTVELDGPDTKRERELLEAVLKAAQESSQARSAGPLVA